VAEPVDHYGYWHRHAPKRTGVLDRERVHLELLRRVARPGQAYLDAGCGDGRFLRLMAKALPEPILAGADYSPEPVAAARAAGLDVREANFEAGLPYDDAAFDVVNAAQVIEHLYNPDRFLRELRRVLRPNGFLVLSTPNLCAWFNRVLVPLGTQPIFYETSTESTLVGAGFLAGLKKGDHPVGHVRLFTERALKDLLERHGFTALVSRGAVFDEGLPRAALALDRVFAFRPSLAALLVVLARARPS
jgi:SAM-dependent methyltransferase